MVESRKNRLGRLERRQFVAGAAATGTLAVQGALGTRPAVAQAQAGTLVMIAAPATPQCLDIEFDVSLGSIDSLGAFYEYMLAHERIPDPQNANVLREDTGVHPDKKNGLALRSRLATDWEIAEDGRRATFKLRDGSYW